MPRTRANGIEIEYETDGARDGRPLLLLRGLGTQLIQWHPRAVSSLNPKTGQLYWEVRMRASIPVPTPVVAGGLV